MEKKKIIIPVVVAVVLLIGGGAFAIRGRSVHKDTNIATGTDAKEVQSMAENTDEEATAESSKPETTKDTENTDKKDTETVAQDKPKKDDTKPQQTTQAATTEANTKPQQAASTNTKPQTTETEITSNTKPQQTTQAATTEANTKPQQTTTEAQPQKEKVWVVDQAAYDEERPIYETRCRGVCTGCGGYMYSQADVDNHLCNASWYDEYYDIQIGTETIHHDEVGHWEYR